MRYVSYNCTDFFYIKNGLIVLRFITIVLEFFVSEDIYEVVLFLCLVVLSILFNNCSLLSFNNECLLNKDKPFLDFDFEFLIEFVCDISLS